MRKTPYLLQHLAVMSCCIVGAPFAAATIPAMNVGGNDGTGSAWRGIINSSRTGYVVDSGGKTTPGPMGENDSQTGQQVADMVGDATRPTVYFGYGTLGSSAGTTTRSVNRATGASYSLNNISAIGFRLRLDRFDTLSALKQVTWVGFDLDGNSKVDLMIGADIKSHNSIFTVITTTDNASTNDSPSNTGINYGSGNTGASAARTLYTYTSSGADSLVNYQQVTSTNSTVGGVTTVNGNADAFLSFVVPYADFVSAVNVVMGTNYTTATFDSTATFRVSAGTSQQDNNINQDAFGNIASPYVFTPEMNTTGTIGSTINPIPEPATALGLAALVGPAFYCASRRRYRSVRA